VVFAPIMGPRALAVLFGIAPISKLGLRTILELQLATSSSNAKPWAT
jgi:hypothetical protein